MPDKQFRSWDIDQLLLLPPSVRDWLPEDHLVYRVLDLVESLDLSEIEAEYLGKDARGTRPYHPRMMMALLLYSYCVGLRSSRKIAQATFEWIPFRVLAADRHPHFTVINRFRIRHRASLQGLFSQVLELCHRLGMVQLGHVSVDGSKVAADASKHKAMSYGRMEPEAKRLESEIAEWLDQSEATDRKEDELYGPGQEADPVPEELRRRESRLQRIRQAQAELESEAKRARAAELNRQAYEQREKVADTDDPIERKRKTTRARKAQETAQRLWDEAGEEEDSAARQFSRWRWPHHQVPCTVKGQPKGTAQRNFTDPDSRVMMRDGAFIQGYNCQVAVDAGHQIVVAQSVSNQAPDQQHFVPLLQQIRDRLGQNPRQVSADAGYYDDRHVTYCQDHKIDPYLAVQRTRRKQDEDAASIPDPVSPTRARMQAKIREDSGRAIYARRKVIVEPVFGQIKQARGFRRFSLRGLEKVQAEWTLVTLSHNVLKLLSEMGRRALPLSVALQRAPAAT